MAISDFKSRIDELRFNPSAIHRLIINEVVERSNGSKNVLDATNPWFLCIDGIAELGAAGLFRNESSMASLYPIMAQSWEDLYRHMSDEDYLGRFSTPAQAEIIIALDKAEFIKKAVATGAGNIKKLTIPRHTEITVAGYTFTLQYPIDIRLMGHGGIHVVYDGDIDSPVETLTTNLVKWKEVVINNIKMICLYIPINQFAIKSYTDTLTSATPFNTTYTLADQYYFCRVFHRSTGDTEWTEMVTTHTKQVFDPLDPTALLIVEDDTLTVKIPPVYYQRSLLKDEIRIDVFTTKGAITVDLGSVDINNYVVNWRDLDTEESSVFSAPLSNFGTLSVWSNDTIDAGTDSVDFETMRQRVITNSMGGTDQPITPSQLSTRLEDAGFKKVLDVDNITNRIFLAVRPLPAPEDEATSSGIAATIATLSSTLDELGAYTAVNVHSTGRYTITPDAIYDLDNGVPTLLTATEVAGIKARSPELIMNIVNSRTLGFSPFHYILDPTRNQFELRPYYMDDPIINYKTFVIENDTLGLEISTDTYYIERTTTGYRLTLKVKSGSLIKAMDDELIVPQLSIIPEDDSVRGFINGTLSGTLDGERVYQFELETDFDIDLNNQIQVKNFKMFEGDTRTISIGLETEFTLIYSVINYSTEGIEISSIDDKLGRFLMTNGNPTGVIEETFNITFGYALDHLWSNSRSTISAYGYEKYGSDVLAYWDKTVLADPPVITDNGDGTYSAAILHAQGDPVIDDVTGEQVVLHYADDVIMVDGEPVINQGRGLQRQMDILLLDGRYKFATDDDTLSYVGSVPGVISTWVTGVLSELNDLALENTEILYYPEIGTGTVKALADESETVTVPAHQRFTVVFYVDDVTYKNTDLRNALEKTAVKTVAELLNNTTVSLTMMVDAIWESTSDDIISVKVTGLADDAGESYEVITLLDNSARMSIGKRLTVLENGKLAIEDDFTVEFVRHASNS